MEKRYLNYINFRKAWLVLTALGFLFVSSSCVSVKKFNAHIEKPKGVKELKADVDFVHKKLEKHHPSLFWYIDKADLDYKFDSLKSDINEPMTSNEFFFKLSPLVALVRQGHTRLLPVVERSTRREAKALRKKGAFPLAQFDFEVMGDRLFIAENRSADSSIRVGAEVLQVNGVKPKEVISKFAETYTSDGYNTTFYHHFMGWQFPNYFYVYTKERDSVSLSLQYGDSLINSTLKHGAKNETNVKKDSLNREEKKLAKREAKQEAQKRRLHGYNPAKKHYSKELNFVGTDRSIALLRIRDFSRGSFKKFYANTFTQLDSLGAHTLIIDLRDNPGGKLRDIASLYSFLSDSNFVLIDRMEVVSRSRFVFGAVTIGTSWYVKAAAFTVGLPALAYLAARISKKDGRYYSRIPESKLKKPNPKHFKGKVYVLINGGSFSASSIISSNLKGSGRATFVGEETGGAYNGCVAGFMPIVSLPNSKLGLRLGLATIRPHYKTPLEGRGILPDIPIEPTPLDLLQGNDPELQWIIDEVEGRH